MAVNDVTSTEEIKLPLLHLLSNNLMIECGELDGAVLGLWRHISKYSNVPVIDDDDTHDCYWAAAAVWSDAWDQRTIDRVSLFLHFTMNIVFKYTFMFRGQFRLSE